MISYTELDQESVPRYALMTYPYYRSWFADRPDVLVGMCASSFGVPCGLALASAPKACPEAIILSLYVDPAFRGQGIGTMLLARLEEVLRNRGHREMEIIFNGSIPCASSVGRILEKLGWSAPELHMLLLYSDSRVAKGAFMRRRRLPESYSLFPWADLTPSEKAALAAAQRPGGWIPSWVKLFPNDLCLRNSLGLRWHGEVTGFLLTREMTPGTVSYAALVIRPDCRGGCAVPLFAEGFRLQFCVEPVEQPCASMMVAPHAPTMMRFAERYIPYCTRTSKSWCSRKPLSPKPLPGM